MDPLSIAFLALRIAAGFLSPAAARAVDLIERAHAAGKNVDADLAEVAAKLKAGDPADWDGVVARIEASSADLHSPPG